MIQILSNVLCTASFIVYMLLSFKTTHMIKMIVFPHHHQHLRSGRAAATSLASLLFAACIVYMSGQSTRMVEQRTVIGRHRMTAHVAPRSSQALHPSLLSKPIMQPRRNHGCAFLGDTMVLVAGRYAPSVELWDTVTGMQTKVAANKSMLDVNHFQLAVADGSEIWIPCGFRGSDLDQEIHMEETLIIDAGQGYTMKRGPRLDHPRGGCGALALDVDGPRRPQHICVFGGSAGQHDRGNFTNTVSCYDRARGLWHRPLPQLPIPADHLNLVHLPAGTTCDGKVHPERIVYLAFRNQSYTAARPEVFAFDILRDTTGAIDVGPTIAKGWYQAAVSVPGPELTRDAAGVAVSPSGRFIFTFGGVHYGEVRSSYDVFRDVVAIDMCTGRSFVLDKQVDMREDRFAVVTCQSDGGYAVTCGGKSKAPGNLGSCDVHSLRFLEQLALRSADTGS